MKNQQVEAFFGGGCCDARPFRLRVWSPQDLDWGRAAVLSLHAQSQSFVGDATLFIPKVIHFIWFGPNPLPHQHDDHDGGPWNSIMESWRQHHPDWTIHVWTEQDLEQFDYIVNRKALQYALDNNLYGMASDIARLEILHQRGGLYVDVDYLCVDAVDELHRQFHLYCGASNTGCIEINNGILASRSGHYMLSQMMNSISTWFDAWQEHCRNQQDILSTMSGFLDSKSATSLIQATTSTTTLSHDDVIANTGPGLLTRTVGQYLTAADSNNQDDDTSRIAILPFHVFHPVPNTLRHGITEKVIQAHIVPGKTKAVHLWSCSWQQ